MQSQPPQFVVLELPFGTQMRTSYERIHPGVVVGVNERVAGQELCDWGLEESWE